MASNQFTAGGGGGAMDAFNFSAGDSDDDDDGGGSAAASIASITSQVNRIISGATGSSSDDADDADDSGGGGSDRMGSDRRLFQKAKEIEQEQDDTPEQPAGTGLTAGRGGSSGSSRSSDADDGRTDTSGREGFRSKVIEGAKDVGGAVDDATDDAFEDAEETTEAAKQGFLEKSGIAGFHRSEEGRELREAFNEQGQEGGAIGRLKQFDTAARTGFDIVLDNPNASGQDTARAGISKATGMNDEELAQAAQDVDEGVTESIDDRVEGTAFDNPVTGGVRWLGDAVIGDVIRAGVGATTGIDTEEGDTEATVGAVDAFDLGVTIGTAGAGGAATSLLARGSDDAVRAADEAAGGAGAVDDAAQAGEDAVDRGTGIATDGGRTVDDGATMAEESDVVADEAPAGFQRFVDEFSQGSDDAARGADQSAVDDAISRVDDAGQAADDTPPYRRVLDDAFGASDEATQAGDDAAGAVDDAAAGGDDAAGAVDDAAAAGEDAADEGGSLLDDFLQGADEGAQGGSSLINKWTAGAGLGGLLGGGALATTLGGGGGGTEDDPTDYPDEMTTDDGHSLSSVKTYDPIERFPNGGKLYAVVGPSLENEGYWLLLGRRGRNLIVLTGDGTTRTAKISPEQFSQMMQAQSGGEGQGANA